MDFSKPIRVFAATQNQIFILGLKRLLESSTRPMEWVGSHPPDTHLMTEIQRRKPCLVIADEEIRARSADLPARLNAQQIGLLVMSPSRNLFELETMVRFGARGVVHMGEPEDVLLTAIQQVAAAHMWLPQELSERMVSKAIGGIFGLRASPEETRIGQLTKKERHLITMLVKHPEAKAFTLGALMNISESTIRNHLCIIYRKLQLRGKAALILFANRYHLA